MAVKRFRGIPPTIDEGRTIQYRDSTDRQQQNITTGAKTKQNSGRKKGPPR